MKTISLFYSAACHAKEFETEKIRILMCEFKHLEYTLREW